MFLLGTETQKKAAKFRPLAMTKLRGKKRNPHPEVTLKITGNPTDEDIRSKRMEALAGAYELTLKWDRAHRGDVFTALDKKKVALAVEEYIDQWKTIKERDKIPHRIQRPKIAGLMASAIMHHKPLRDHYRGDFEGLDSVNSWYNEDLALFHGVATCAEDCSPEQIQSLLKNPHFRTWADDFTTLLRYGSPSRESLINIFETLCLGFFPDALKHYCVKH